MLRVSMPLIFMSPIWPFGSAIHSPSSCKSGGRRFGGLNGRALREHLEPSGKPRITLAPTVLGRAQIEIPDRAGNCQFADGRLGGEFGCHPIRHSERGLDRLGLTLKN